MSSRACQYIHTAVALLATSVKKTDDDKMGKLRQVLKYMKGTKELKVILKVGDVSVLHGEWTL